MLPHFRIAYTLAVIAMDHDFANLGRDREVDQRTIR